MSINTEAVIWTASWVLAWQFGPRLLDQYFLRRFPPAPQPEAVRSAALLELCTGGLLLAMGIVFLSFFPCLAIRLLLVISSGWVIASWLLRRGSTTIRWIFIPLSVLRLLIPIYGWIVTPACIYFLFINRDARSYFSQQANRA